MIKYIKYMHKYIHTGAPLRILGPWTAHSLGPSCIPGGGGGGGGGGVIYYRNRIGGGGGIYYRNRIGGGGSRASLFFPLLPNQIILFQLLKSFSFVCNGKVIIFRFVFL